MRFHWQALILSILSMSVLYPSSRCECQKHGYIFLKEEYVDKATAEARCRDRNLILPVIKSSSDTRMFDEFRSECWVIDALWIGLSLPEHSSSPMDFLWTDGSPLSWTFWGEHYEVALEKCVVAKGFDLNWYITQCSKDRLYACQLGGESQASAVITKDYSTLVAAAEFSTATQRTSTTPPKRSREIQITSSATPKAGMETRWTSSVTLRTATDSQQTSNSAKANTDWKSASGWTSRRPTVSTEPPQATRADQETIYTLVPASLPVGSPLMVTHSRGYIRCAAECNLHRYCCLILQSSNGTCFLYPSTVSLMQSISTTVGRVYRKDNA